MTDELREKLTRASRGLLFPSESDRPFEFVRLGVNDRIAEVTPARVAEILGRPGERASEWPAGRFLGLEGALTDALGSVRVFRVGVVEVLVLAIGNDPETGELAGLSTIAIET